MSLKSTRFQLYRATVFFALLTLVSCKPAATFDSLLTTLKEMKPKPRWNSIELIKLEHSNSSLKLSDIAQRSDHISSVLALLLLSDMDWQRGVQDRVIQLSMASRDSLVRAAAVRALRRKHYHQDRIKTLLFSRLNDKAWQSRRMALRSLLFFRIPKNEQVALCRRFLKDPHPSVRWDAVTCWRRLTLGSSMGANVLAPMLLDPSSRVQKMVTESLGWWGPKAIPALMKTLKHRNEAMRCQAIMAMGDFRRSFGLIIPRLSQAIQSGAGVVPACAVRALNKLSSHTSIVLGPLMKALQHKQQSVVIDAISSLQRLGKVARPAIPLLFQLAKNPKKSLYLRYAAVNAIRYVVPNREDSEWKKATLIHQRMYKRVQQSLFAPGSDPIDATMEVSLSHLWGVGISTKVFLFHIEKEYVPELKACAMNLDGTKKTLWVELFLKRRGQVVLPLVFELDRKTPVYNSCINQSVWSWKFPRLRSNRYGYLQFQIHFSTPESNELQIDVSEDSSSSSGMVK